MASIDLNRAPFDVARDLLGLTLIHVKGGRQTSGRIVEVEAYGGQGEDDCAHAHRGKTLRNSVMFGPPGRLYVYFTYGMHHCANIVAYEPGAKGGAVLLRALEPLSGIEFMRKRRRRQDLVDLCSGPAKLVEAMGLRRADDGRRIGTSTLWLEGESAPEASIVSGPRIGVRCSAADRPWRVGVTDSVWLSKPFG